MARRSQYCREHIDKVAEECGLEKSTVSDVKQAAKFCDEYSEFSDCSTHAVMALIRIRDEQVKARAISLAENHLKQTTPTGGKKQKFLTEREVRTFIKKADLEVRKDFMDETPLIKTEPAPTAPAKSPGPGWHPSTNNCHGCAVLGYEKAPKSKKFVHICTVAKPADGFLYGQAPYGMEKCPLGTGPVKVGCQFWGEDTLCHNPHGLECTASTRGKYHCPLMPGSGGFSPALELMRRQAYRNPQTGGLTTDYCRNKPGVDGCPHLKKREMNNTLECEIEGKVPGNMVTCPFTKKEGESPVPGWQPPADLRSTAQREDEEGRDSVDNVTKQSPTQPSDDAATSALPHTSAQDESLIDGDPGWQEYLYRQIDRCREKKCNELIELEGIRPACTVMKGHEGTKRPWRRYDCPLRPDIPKGKPGSAGMTVRAPVAERRPQDSKIGLFDRSQPLPGQETAVYKVEAGRQDQMMIRQIVKRGLAEDEQEAVQSAFEEGLNLIMDRIDAMVQRETALEGINEVEP